MRTLNIFPYAGNKSRVMNQILPHFPEEITHYWEPFCGTASVAYSLRGRISGQIFLSDTNAELTALLLQVQQDPKKLIKKVYDLMKGEGMPTWEELDVDSTMVGPHSEALSRLKSASDHTKAWYNGEVGGREFKVRHEELRNHLNLLMTTSRQYIQESRVAAAALFYIIQRLCVSGVYRLNSAGQNNVPLSKERDITDPVKLSHWQRILQDWHPFLTSKVESPGGESLPPSGQDKVNVASFSYDDPFPAWNSLPPEKLCIYVDPPYLGGDQSYTPSPWRTQEHQKLVEWIRAQPCKVIVSNSIEALPLYESLPGRIERIVRNARYGSTEILYISP